MDLEVWLSLLPCCVSLMPIITQEDIKKCRRAFKKLDHDNDGTIQVHELRHHLENHCTPEQITVIINIADADKSGRIDFAEFLRVAQTQIPTTEKKEWGDNDDGRPSTPALKDLLPDDFSHSTTKVDGDFEGNYSQKNEDESENKKKFRCCYCIPLIHPESNFSNAWQALTGLAIMYAALVTPVLLAFQDQFVGEGKNQILLVDSVVNGIFMADIIFNFCAMYINSKGDLVTSPKSIAFRYSTTWLIPDAVSCIPLDLLLGSGDGQGLLYAKLARMGKLARVLRLLKILKILKLVRLLKFWSQFDRIFQRVLTNDKYEGEASKMYQFGKFCACALLTAHVAGCLWYALAKFHENVEDTWIVSRGIEDAAIIDQYLASMYFIITTLTTVGYGDISASTNAEIIVAILLMMGGVLGYSISVGTVSSVLMEEDQRQTIITNKMQTLAHFAKDTNMDLIEYGKIRRHIKRKFTESLDWMEHLTGSAQLQSLLNDLPVVLRAKMLRHMHHGRHLNLEFFSRYRDDDFFSYAVPLLSSAQFDSHDMIYLRGDYAERVYFLTKGTVVFFSFEDNGHLNGEKTQRQLMDRKEYLEIEEAMKLAEPFQVFVDGSTFGDFELLLGIPRQVYVRCDIQSDCLVLHKKDLLRTLAEFPVIAESMRANARQDYITTMKRKIAHDESKGIQSQTRISLYDDIREADEVLKLPTPADDMSKIPGEKPGADASPFSALKRSSTAGEQLEESPPISRQLSPRSLAVNRLPLASPRSKSEDSGLAHRFQHVEDRLDFIEMKQEKILQNAAEAKERQSKMMKEIEEMRTTLFGIDLRIQSLVLRN